jgi:hypothetical protein
MNDATPQAPSALPLDGQGWRLDRPAGLVSAGRHRLAAAKTAPGNMDH